MSHFGLEAMKYLFFLVVLLVYMHNPSVAKPIYDRRFRGGQIVSPPSKFNWLNPQKVPMSSLPPLGLIPPPSTRYDRLLRSGGPVPPSPKANDLRRQIPFPPPAPAP